ncbi:biotin transporter BioY [Lutibaculum baratangense]|uniref:Biotin transporter n=1 Tax=Lutibaculum baratangense AMV1 TaxID=631454 RepID=V4QRS5_9HYPH|nr:biotin transporter BioY [Lutibaculum baratangense]ESR22437.1 Substrate-specific component BioY of biotin ECF transporter [Lutibaculum baratangense AMV1]
MAIDATGTTLIDRIWPARADGRVMRNIAIVLVGSALMTISAKIQVPFWPVPITMQTYVALMLGAVLGFRLGAASVAAYLAQGAIGLPVFAGGAGLAYLAGPTGGYLLGFLAAAAVTGVLADRGFGRRFVSALAMFLLGNIAIFALGLGWLATLIGVEKAIAGGLVPFLPGEALKVALAMASLPLAWKALSRR